MSGSSMVPKHKINNISANNKAMLVKLGTVQYCTLRSKSHGAYFDVAMATLLVLDVFYAERQSLIFSHLIRCGYL